MKITAKVRCNTRTSIGTETDSVTFAPDYNDADGNVINAEWARYTPGLSITMGVRKSVAFEVGKSYTLTFDDGE